MSGKILRRCEFCGKEFYTWNRIALAGNGRFCSRPCASRRKFCCFKVDTETVGVRLTQGKVALIDACDVDLVSGVRWSAKRFPCSYYASGYLNGASVPMHRVIMQPRPDEQVDHIDGNGLNNKGSNLRVVTARGNAQNKHVHKSSRYVGVCKPSKYPNKWYATVNVGKRHFFLGSFDNEADANASYVSACAAIEVGTFVPPERKVRDLPKGIYLCNSRRGQFRVQIRRNGVTHDGGVFPTIEEALIGYQELERLISSAA